MSAIATNRVLFVLALAGVGVSGYLTAAHLNFVDLGCSAIHGCEEVARHYTARGFGIPALRSIPTAAFGMMMYVALIALSFIRVTSESQSVARAASLAQWLLAAAGVLITLWLTYLEAYVIHAWCQWCLISAAITLAVFLVSTAERLAPRKPRPSGEPA